MAAKSELAELQVLITAKTDEFNSAISGVQSRLGSLEKSVGSSTNKIGLKTIALGSTIGNVLSNLISKAVSVITSNIDYATKRLDTLNRFPIVLQNLGISADEASKAIQTLAEYTLGLPTTLNDAAEKVQYFTSATGNVGQSIKIFEALNDAIVSGAQTADVQSTALYQWSQAIVRGSFDIEREFNAMVVANAKAVNEISEKLLGTGKDFNDLWEALKKGTVSVNDLCNAMVYLDQNGVGGLESWSQRARNSVSGIDTAITRFKTNIGKAVAVVAEEIGWKNIYTFINNVGDAIYKAGQYVAAFVRIIKEAFAWVSALFGGSGSTNEIVKETASAADNMSSIASGASDTADNLSDANSQAAKLKRQLAGFDELNVISENKNSSGSSGSGGGSGGINVGDLEWDSGLSSTADKVAAIAEKIKAAFKEIFGEIDFTRLGNAFKNLGTGIKKAFDSALVSGKNFINSFIVPVTKFAIEDTLPRVFDAWGNALNGIDYSKIEGALNNVFKALADVVERILDAFAGLNELIAPVVEWFANFVVPPALNIIATILEVISNILGGLIDAFKDFFNTLQPSFEKLGNALSPVFDAINDFFGSIAENDEVMQAFHDITKAIADVLLNVLAVAIKFVIDVIVGIIDVIKAVIDWFVKAFNGIKACWDDAPDFFSGLWNFIKMIFSPVVDFFKGIFSAAIEVVKNIWNGITSFFSGLWNGIKNVFSAVGNWFGNIFSGAYNAIKNTFSGIGNWFSDRWNDIKNVFGNAFNIFKDIGANIWNGLKNGLSNVVNGVKNIFSSAVDGIKSFLGINSPSRLFAQLGSYVGEGFAQGIEGETDTVTDALNGLTSGFKLGLPSLGTINSRGVADSIGLDGSDSGQPFIVELDGDVLAKKIIDRTQRRSFIKNMDVV